MWPFPVVVQAVGGSSPLAHPSKVPANGHFSEFGTSQSKARWGTIGEQVFPEPRLGTKARALAQLASLRRGLPRLAAPVSAAGERRWGIAKP
jgi:hypothetical protein